MDLNKIYAVYMVSFLRYWIQCNKDTLHKIECYYTNGNKGFNQHMKKKLILLECFSYFGPTCRSLASWFSTIQCVRDTLGFQSKMFF